MREAGKGFMRGRNQAAFGDQPQSLVRPGASPGTTGFPRSLCLIERKKKKAAVLLPFDLTEFSGRNCQ